MQIWRYHRHPIDPRAQPLLSGAGGLWRVLLGVALEDVVRLHVGFGHGHLRFCGSLFGHPQPGRGSLLSSILHDAVGSLDDGGDLLLIDNRSRDH
ncbi:hypothetical protein [Acidithiobacillus sp. PG05]|uniref:hypothetical protein n=1 Tax=Acidithiobacillus sp. PG05 TaxID=2801581 RepID=UPI001F1512A5|nr:hypothetical protein [Acidithiobacillus sp. PG05]